MTRAWHWQRRSWGSYRNCAQPSSTHWSEFLTDINTCIVLLSKTRAVSRTLAERNWCPKMKENEAFLQVLYSWKWDWGWDYTQICGQGIDGSRLEAKCLSTKIHEDGRTHLMPRENPSLRPNHNNIWLNMAIIELHSGSRTRSCLKVSGMNPFNHIWKKL